MFRTAIKKEFTLVFRDLHSLLVLFVMPAVFIVIMSLAMQDRFGPGQDSALNGVIVSENSGQIASVLTDAFLKSSEILFSKGDFNDLQQLQRQLIDDQFQILVVLPADIDEHFSSSGDADYTPIKAWLSPNVTTPLRLLIDSQLKQAYSGIRIASISPDLSTEIVRQNDIQLSYSGVQDENSVTPSSVQQNVPAWLVFSMFFVVVPIATTLITERQFGTLARLRTMNVSMTAFLIAKLLPYLVINQLQMLIMLLIGVTVIPLFGGDALQLGGSLPALLVMSLAVGLAALGYGLIVAVLCKTTEQATSVGAVGNVLLGALGGIMVPKFVMPPFLQDLTNISPMAWGLEGFLDVLLRGGDLRQILPEVGLLLAFSVAMLSLSLILFSKRA